MWNHVPSSKKPIVPTAEPAIQPRPLVEAPRVASIGKSVVIKGDVIGSEDMTIDGRVEGRIELRGHNLLIGPNAQIQAELVARTITIMGSVNGDITASDKIEIRKAGSVDGNLDAPKVVLAEGAELRGRIDTLSRTLEQRQPLSIAV